MARYSMNFTPFTEIFMHKSVIVLLCVLPVVMNVNQG